MVDVPAVIRQLDAHDATSVEKITEILAGVRMIDPGSDEQLAQKLALFGMLAPHVVPLLPHDPDELDRLLELGAQLFVALRSYDAEPISLVGTPPAPVVPLPDAPRDAA